VRQPLRLSITRLRLAFAALDGVGPHQAQADADAEDVFSMAWARRARSFLQGAHRVAEHLRRDFHLDRHLVQALLAGEDDLVVGQRALHVEQGGFHLGGNTLTPRMMNMSSERRPMRRMRRMVRPQPQGSVQDGGDVAGAVADHRHRALGERGQHQLALLAVGQGRRRSPGR
jgi:hypothetical protein